MLELTTTTPPRGETLRAEQCERFARLCADRLARAKEPKVRERLVRERGDWLALAASRTLERNVRVIEQLRTFA